MRLSIRTVLLAALVGLQLGAVGIVFTSSYLKSETAARAHVHGIMADKTDSTVQRIEDFLAPAKTAVELARSLHAQGVIGSEDSPRLERYFFEQLKASPQISGVYYGDETGKFTFVSRSSKVAEAQFRTKVMLPDASGAILTFRNMDYDPIALQIDAEDRYDPRARPWYKLALEREETVWTDPYIFYSSQQPGITVAAPIFADDGRVAGVMGIDMEIAAISGFLADIKIGDSGSVLLLSDGGEVIAHPNPEIIKRVKEDGEKGLRFASIAEINDPVARGAFLSFDEPETVIRPSRNHFTRFDVGGKIHDAVFSPFDIGNLRWAIAIHVPEDDFLGALIENRRDMGALALFIAGITIVIGWLISRSITRPLTALSTYADQLARGHRPDISSFPANFTELERVGTAFRRMMRWMDRYREKNEQMTRELISWSRELETRVEERTSELRDANGKLRSEIAERAEAERKLASEIERHQETGRDLKWALAEAHAASEAKTRFLSCMSHELRTPLNAIIGFGQMLDGCAGQLSEDKKVEYARYILESGARLLSMINQVLDLAGIEAGKVLLSIEAIRPRSVIRRVVNEANVLADQRGIVLINETADETLPSISADEARLTQSLVNLVSNAIKYNRDGGEVRVWAEIRGEIMRLNVSDTGRGIPSDQHAEVFETFNRLGVEATKIEGSGVGLSLTKEFIEKMGGEIGFDSVEGEGSTFWFELPIDRSEDAALEQLTAIAEAS